MSSLRDVIVSPPLSCCLDYCAPRPVSPHAVRPFGYSGAPNSIRLSATKRLRGERSMRAYEHGLSSRRVFLHGAAAAASAAVVGCAAADTEGDLYPRARSEGQLDLYGGGPTAAFTNWARQYEAAFPRLKVNLVSAFSNELSPRIDAQIAAGKVEADVAILQTLQDFDRWTRQGELLGFEPDSFREIPPLFRDPPGTNFPLPPVPVPYAYNPHRLAPDRVPPAPTHFLKPA